MSGQGPCRLRQVHSGHGVQLQALIPAMEHAEEADLGSQMAWITSNFKQGLSTSMEQQVVDEPLVLQGE